MKKLTCMYACLIIVCVICVITPTYGGKNVRNIGMSEYWDYIDILHSHGAVGDGYRWCITRLYDCASLPWSIWEMESSELYTLANAEEIAVGIISDHGVRGNAALLVYSCRAGQMAATIKDEDLPENIWEELGDLAEPILLGSWLGGVPAEWINANPNWLYNYDDLAEDNPDWAAETDEWELWVLEEHPDWITNPPPGWDVHIEGNEFFESENPGDHDDHSPY